MRTDPVPRPILAPARVSRLRGKSHHCLGLDRQRLPRLDQDGTDLLPSACPLGLNPIHLAGNLTTSRFPSAVLRGFIVIPDLFVVVG